MRENDCGSERQGRIGPCLLRSGHTGSHIDYSGFEWSDAEELEPSENWTIGLVEEVGKEIIFGYRSIGYLSDAQRAKIYRVIRIVEDSIFSRSDESEAEAEAEAE